MTRGVVYFITGWHYLGLAVDSLNSLRRFHPNMHATLICNDDIDPGPFNDVVRYTPASEYPNDEMMLSRALALADAPYDYNLFLDADTYIDSPLDDLFQLMERFDIAMQQSETIVAGSLKNDLRQFLGRPAAVMHQPGADYLAHLADIPLSFPEYCCGTMLWRWSPVTRKLFADWVTEMRRWILACPDRLCGHSLHSDQTPLRLVLYNSDARIATLPPHSVCRTMGGGLIRGRAAILHGCRNRRGQLAKVAGLINQGQIHGSIGELRYHCADGSVVLLKPQRGLLPDDRWLDRRKGLIGE